MKIHEGNITDDLKVLGAIAEIKEAISKINCYVKKLKLEKKADVESISDDNFRKANDLQFALETSLAKIENSLISGNIHELNEEYVYHFKNLNDRIQKIT